MTDDTTRGAARPRLSDILDGNVESIRKQWGETEAAADFAPLPSGTYTCRVIAGELFTAKSGTPGYKLTFRILDGEHAGRQVWHDLWLTPAALPMTKRDLGKLGVTDPGQLESPLPTGIRCSVKVALRRDDEGTQYNRIRGFDVLGIDADPAVDPDFAPDDDDAGNREGGDNES
jgi:Protein of unknown function (DUF669)